MIEKRERDREGRSLCITEENADMRESGEEEKNFSPSCMHTSMREETKERLGRERRTKEFSFVSPLYMRVHMHAQKSE